MACLIEQPHCLLPSLGSGLPVDVKSVTALGALAEILSVPESVPLLGVLADTNSLSESGSQQFVQLSSFFTAVVQPV